MIRTWWLDTIDLEGAKRRLEIEKASHMQDWETVRFDESTYGSSDEAASALMVLMTTPPTFAPGKIILCQEIPVRKASEKQQKRFADLLYEIPENVLLLVMTRLDRTTSLYKTIVKLAKEGLAKAESPAPLSEDTAVAWTNERAAELKLTVDPLAGLLLARLSEMNPGKICGELRKLKAFSTNGHISAKMVETVAFGQGTVNIFALGEKMLAKDEEGAHKVLQTLFDHDEDPEGICAILQEWLQRLWFLEGHDRNLKATQAACDGIMKWKKEKGTKDREVVNIPTWGRFFRDKGESVPMFSNPQAFWHSWDAMQKNATPREWACYAYKKLGEVWLKMRMEGRNVDPKRLLQYYVSEMVVCQKVKKVKYRT